MNREIELNWPMFIAIVLIIVSITAILVYGINGFKNAMQRDRNMMYNQLQELRTEQNVI